MGIILAVVLLVLSNRQTTTDQTPDASGVSAVVHDGKEHHRPDNAAKGQDSKTQDEKQAAASEESEAGWAGESASQEDSSKSASAEKSASAKKQTAASVTYQRRGNARYDFHLLVPSFMQQADEAENGDGLAYVLKHKARLTAWGSYNVMGETLKERFETERKGAAYSRMKGNWFVVSRKVSGGKILYSKTVYRAEDDAFLTAQLTYPANQQEEYAPVIEKIFTAFPN